MSRTQDAPVPAHPAVDAGVNAAIATRRSVRGFTDEAVPPDLVRHLLRLASRSPSATNTQPWLVHVLTGVARARLVEEIAAAHAAGDIPSMEYPYYPETWPELHLGRRRQIGWALYGLLGIDKSDKADMSRQHGRNFTFFGAPVGLIFTVHRDLRQGSWIDLGMFMQSIMIAARGCGLDTCPQAAFASYHAIIRRQLGIGDEQIVACGMALGHADPNEPANRLASPREPVSGFARFHDA